MILSNPIFEIFYLAAVVIIWSMLVYQGLLTAGGFFYGRKKPAAVIPEEQLPFVSILIPARNEEKVILNTVDRLIKLDYPKEKLEIIIINDGSTDKTREILESIHDERLTVLNIPIEESGKGKSRALNTGVKLAKGDIVGVYDADNRPEPASLKLLVNALMADRSYVAAIGKFRCINKNKSLMTRFVNIETIAFQWIVQAGRSFFFKIGVLPGTNFIIWKQPVLESGGWDEKALTEDAELSMRLYKSGWKIKFVTQAVTWEQEPSTLKVWIKQRTRWVRGNNYVLSRLGKIFTQFKPRVIGWEWMFFSGMYYVFFAATILSDIFFILGLLNVVSIQIQGPFLEVWIVAYLLFVSEIVLMLSREKDEDSYSNILIVALMYFTYCQLWLLVVINAFIKDYVKREKHTWYKTERQVVD